MLLNDLQKAGNTIYDFLSGNDVRELVDMLIRRAPRINLDELKNP